MRCALGRYAYMLAVVTGLPLAVVGTRALTQRPIAHANVTSVERDRRGIAEGDEVLLVFIGASFCHAADVQGFPASLEHLKELARARGARANIRVGVIGVALDWAVVDGLKWLNRFGQFDEVSAGRNWLNAGAVDYIWKGTPGPAAVTQLIVLRRRVIPLVRSLLVDSVRVVVRKVGADEIMAWESMGAPIPTLP